MDTKVRYGSLGVDPMLLRKENPHKFLGTTTPTVAPEGSKGRVPERSNFGSRKRGNLDPIEGLGDGSGSDHFLFGAEGNGGPADDTGSTSPEG
jgi:hypothetical protein